MKRLLALTVVIGLATVAGAQEKSATAQSLISPFANNKGEPAALPVISQSQNGRATTITVDVTGAQSWDRLSDTSNQWFYVSIPAGKVMTGIGWDVNLTTVGGSWLSEARFYFDGSDLDLYGLFLAPGVNDTFPGSGSYSSGGIIDLSDNGIPDIPILADGTLYIELYESYDDYADAVDADWTSPSTLTIVYDDPPAPRCAIWTEDFDGGTWPPTGWQTVDNTGNGDWNTNTFYNASNSVPGGSGICATIDSDEIGTVDIDCELWTPPFDLPAFPTMLEYDMDYQNLAGIDYADVDISTDGGATWTNVVQYNADLTGHFVADLSTWAGTPGVIVRFHYYLANWAWWWKLDNISLAAIASAVSRNAVVPNPDSYTVSGPPIMDASFQAMIDVGSTGHGLGELFGYGGPLSFSLGVDRTILIDFAHPDGELLQLDPVAGPIATYDLAVPADCGIMGYTLSTQAVHFGGAPWVLSNAQDMVVGY